MANWDLWPVHAFVDALAAAGVKAAVVSPGSRNTPLTLAFAEHPEIAVYSHLDERSAGFFALGLAKSTGVPVVLCCTSGTATANYYPAVMEAFEARVPLLVVTADRPHQLRDVGANQAVRQPGMYAMHVKWALELPVPDGTQELARHAAAMAARATAVALAAPAGPVHVNYPFVEPLMLPPRAELTRCTSDFDSVAVSLGASPARCVWSRGIVSRAANGQAADVRHRTAAIRRDGSGCRVVLRETRHCPLCRRAVAGAVCPR